MVEYDKFDGCSMEEDQCYLMIRIYGPYEDRPNRDNIVELEIYLRDVIEVLNIEEVNTDGESRSFHIDYSTDRNVIYDDEIEQIKDIVERRGIFTERPDVAVMVDQAYKGKNCYTTDQWDDLERRTKMAGYEGHGRIDNKDFSEYMEEDVGMDNIGEGLGESGGGT